MKQFSLILCLLASLLLQTGCKLTLKKKSAPDTAAQSSELKVGMGKENNSSKNKKVAHLFTERDTKLIGLYYSNEGNAQILKDIIKQTSVSARVANKLETNQVIPGDVQVVPLPLELEKILSPLSGYDLRVQVGKRVMIMDIKSRRILDVIKLQ